VVPQGEAVPVEAAAPRVPVVVVAPAGPP